MALADRKYDAAESLFPGDTPSSMLHDFERMTLDPDSAASDASVFAYALGYESVRQTFTTQEREDAKQFLTEAFKAAGMSGKITTGVSRQYCRCGVSSICPSRILTRPSCFNMEWSNAVQEPEFGTFYL
jgi:hypothetical protein